MARCLNRRNGGSGSTVLINSLTATCISHFEIVPKNVRAQSACSTFTAFSSRKGTGFFFFFTRRQQRVKFAKEGRYLVLPHQFNSFVPREVLSQFLNDIGNGVQIREARVEAVIRSLRNTRS